MADRNIRIVRSLGVALVVLFIVVGTVMAGSALLGPSGDDGGGGPAADASASPAVDAGASGAPSA
jgi:hypothetical protein